MFLLYRLICRKTHPLFIHKLLHCDYSVLLTIRSSSSIFSSRPVFFLLLPPSSVFVSLIHHLPLLIHMLLVILSAPKFLPDLSRTSVLTFITLGCTDKRISLLRLRQSCHVRSVRMSAGGLGSQKCLKLSHKNIRQTFMREKVGCARCPWPPFVSDHRAFSWPNDAPKTPKVVKGVAVEVEDVDVGGSAPSREINGSHKLAPSSVLQSHALSNTPAVPPSC